MTVSKEEWRKTLLQARRQIPKQQRMEETEAALAHARRFLVTQPQAIIALYMPIFGELSPLALADAGEICCVPVIEGDGVMRFARMTSDTPMHPNRFGIAEPMTPEWVTPTLVFTPLVGGDARGTRLGYGKGYYDRYFVSESGARALRVGLAFRCQYVQQLPTEAHDLPLHALATADAWVDYRTI
jgi:5-formyltetrahydrofolate cyclo-ligase